MLIKEIEVKEFRGIKESHKPIPLSEFTVIIGRNNSGKTSLLEALYLFPIPGEKSKVYYGMEYTNQSKSSRSITSLKAKEEIIQVLHTEGTLVYGYSGTSELRYTLGSGNKYILRLDTKGRGEYIIEEDGKEEKLVYEEAIKRISNYLGVKIPEVNDLSVYIPSDTQFLGFLERKLIDLEKEIVKKGLNTKAVRLVKETISDEFTEVLWTKDGVSLRKVLPEGRVAYIRLRDLGSGLKKVLTIVMLLKTLKPKMVLWDDFEISVHPSLIRETLRWLAKENWQVLISTHSIDVLYELLEINKKFSVLQINKDKGDILKYKCLGREELEDTIEANQDPRLLSGMVG
ncbi:hypothetical protein DRN52_02860 [Thermococci archaeon]|nr:MAG: hypothetical protein DRN52_02860 [Thermococci archaeon]